VSTPLAPESQPRFTLQECGNVADVAFDDGGMNLLSSAALTELAAVVERIETKLETNGSPMRVVTFRSSRPRLFAAGADMAEMAAFSGHEAAAFARQGQELFSRLERLACVTVALVDGDCFGGAFDLALAFDLRFATPASRFSHPGSRIGIVTGFGGTSRWRKTLTPAAARKLLLGNPVIDSAAALAAGLIDRIVPSLAECDSEVQRLASLDPATTRMVKELSRHAPRLSQQQTMKLATRLDALHRS
jgi:enoyl-CoA hydratase